MSTIRNADMTRTYDNYTIANYGYRADYNGAAEHMRRT